MRLSNPECRIIPRCYTISDWEWIYMSVCTNTISDWRCSYNYIISKATLNKQKNKWRERDNTPSYQVYNFLARYKDNWRTKSVCECVGGQSYTVCIHCDFIYWLCVGYIRGLYRASGVKVISSVRVWVCECATAAPNAKNLKPEGKLCNRHVGVGYEKENDIIL